MDNIDGTYRRNETMKKELSAALIMLSFPILMAGGNLGNTALSSAGIALLVLNAGFILVPKKNVKDHKK